MSMAELFKKHPTLVVGCGGKVIKIFENQELKPALEDAAKAANEES